MISWLRKNKYYLIIFASCFGLMLLYQFVWTSPDRLAGNDSYTHIAKAEILKEFGFEKASYKEMLPFTYWATINADNTLVYDLYLSILVSIFTSITALKVYISLLFAASATLFYKLINKERRSGLYNCALVFSASVLNIAFLLKFTELRSLVFSIILFYTSLAVLFIYKKKFWLFIPISFFYTLIHTTVFLIFVPIFILIVFDIKNWRKYISAFAYVLIGIGAAVLIYPSSNFYQILAVQPIIPFIYKTASFQIQGAFEVAGDLTNPSYLLISNIVNIFALIVGTIIYFGVIRSKSKINIINIKTASFVLFLLFFILDLFSRRFSDYLTPSMIIFASLHFDDVLLLVKRAKPIVIKYKHILCVILALFLIVFGFFFYQKYLKDNLTNTDYKGDLKSNMPETYQASLFINKSVTKGEYIFNDAWEDFPYFIYYSRDYKYAAGMELGFMYLYDSEMLRFYQDFRDYNGFTETDTDLIYARTNQSFKEIIQTKFKSNTLVIKKGMNEDISNYMLDNYQKLNIKKLYEDSYYVIYSI